MSRNDLNQQFADNFGRNYAYEFDWTIRRYLLEDWAPLVDKGGRSLELGAFKGDMTEQILGYADHLEVVEGSDELAKLISIRFEGKVFVHAKMFEDFKPLHQYKNIFLVHTLEHVDEPMELIKRAFTEWLAPGGRLFVAVPNADALSRQIAVQMGIISYNQAVSQAEALHGHRRTYSLDKLRSEFVGAGVEVEVSGGVLVKTLSNSQFDLALEKGVISEEYLDGLNSLAKWHPTLSASIFCVALKPSDF